MNYLIKIIKNNILLSNFLSLTTLQLFSYILPLITLPYLVTKLTEEFYGIVMFSQSFTMFFSIVIDFGFGLSAVREIASCKGNKRKIEEIYSSIIIIKSILLIISFFLLVTIIYFFSRFSQYQIIYLISFLYVIGQAYFPIWLFQGIEKMKFITIISIIIRIIFTSSIFIFIKDSSDFYLVPLINGVGTIIGAIIALYIIRYKLFIKFRLQSINNIIYYFKDSFKYFISRISVNIYTSSNAFILGILTNNVIVGYYSMAEQLYKAMISMMGPLINSLYPYMVKNKNIVLFKKIIIYLSILCFLGCVFLFFTDKYLLYFLYKDNTNDLTIIVFDIFILVFFIASLSSMLGYPFLGAMGYPDKANNSVIYGGLFHITLLGLIYYFYNISIINIVIITLLTELFIFLYRIVYSFIIFKKFI